MKGRGRGGQKVRLQRGFARQTHICRCVARALTNLGSFSLLLLPSFSFFFFHFVCNQDVFGLFGFSSVDVKRRKIFIYPRKGTGQWVPRTPRVVRAIFHFLMSCYNIFRSGHSLTHSPQGGVIVMSMTGCLVLPSNTIIFRRCHF